MAAALTMDVVELISIATEDTKLLQDRKDGCSWNCVAQTQQSFKVVDNIDTAYAGQEEQFATKLPSWLCGYLTTKFLQST